MSNSPSPLPAADWHVRLETSHDAPHVSKLIEAVFGPGMYARAAFALREGVQSEPDLSFVAHFGSKIIGSVRLTRITWGGRIALMLGPLGVLPEHKSQGIGSALMRTAISAARARAEADGPAVVMLVGDLDYYAPFGFRRIPPHQISLPRPADPARVLVCELTEGAASGFSGAAQKLSD